jgi:hypothetical protein
MMIFVGACQGSASANARRGIPAKAKAGGCRLLGACGLKQKRKRPPF